MPRRRRQSGFGGLLIIVAGAWLIGQVFTGDRAPTPVAPTSVEKVSVPTEKKPELQAVPKKASDAEKQTPKTIEAPRRAEEPRWVKGNKVALRAGPGKEFAILDRFGNGRKLMLVEDLGEWSRVRDELTVRNGWIATRLLSSMDPRVRGKTPNDGAEPRKEPIVVAPPAVPDAAIAEMIIAESINGYSGNCPCPFNLDRAGRRCGKRSAYSRPGGRSPICFVQDVSPAMIQAFRARSQ